MGDRLLPGETFNAPGAPLNDPATAQFDHRLIAYAVLAFAVVQAAAALRGAPAAVARRAIGLAVVARFRSPSAS